MAGPLKQWIQFVANRAPGEPLRPVPLPEDAYPGSCDPVCHAVQCNDIEAVEQLVLVGWDINHRGSSLALAVSQQNQPMVTFLLSRGADPDTPLPYGLTAVMSAVLANRPQQVRGMLAAGARPDRQDEEGRSALWLAANRRRYECLCILLEAGANPNLADHYGTIPLMKAANLSILQRLVEAGSDLSHKDRDGRAVWQHFIRRAPALRILLRGRQAGQLPAALHLWEAWVDRDRARFEAVAEKLHEALKVDQPILDSRTALWWAAFLNSRKWTEYFCEAGWNPNRPDRNGRTPLTATTSPRIVEILLGYGATSCSRA